MPTLNLGPNGLGISLLFSLIPIHNCHPKLLAALCLPAVPGLLPTQPSLQTATSSEQESHKEQQAVKPLTWPPVLSSLPPLDQPSTLYLDPISAPHALQPTGHRLPQSKQSTPASALCPCRALSEHRAPYRPPIHVSSKPCVSWHSSL